VAEKGRPLRDRLRDALRGTAALVTVAAAVALVGSARATSAENRGGILNTPTPTATAALPPGFQDSPVITGLLNPTVVRFSPDGRIFVAEDRGLIKEYDSVSDTAPTIVADLRTEVDAYWDRGLLGMVLDPSFPSKPYVYVIYTYDAPPGGTAPTWNDACPTPPGPTTDGCVVQWRISRLTLSDTQPTTEQVLVQGWCQQFPSHSIGDLQFGPDGYLYASGGEGANFNAVDYGQWGGSLSGTQTVANPCGDPPGGAGTALNPPSAEGGALRSQSVGRAAGEPVTLNGSLLRIDPATGAGAPTNPLSSSPDANARRIVAYGFRNPFRFAFRPGTNEIWVTDVGWNTWEEIDRVVDPTSGPADYGWPCYEGVAPQPSYQSAGLTMCNNLYSSNGGQTGTFGDQTVYSSVDTAGAGLKEVAKYTAAAGSVTKLTGYISGLGQTTGTQNIEAVIYADNNGTPGPLLGVSSPITVTAGRAWGWTDFTFSAPVAVQAGSIWLGYIASDSGDLIQMRYLDQAGSMRWNANSGGYAAGPSNPFGTATSSNKHYSLYATYGTGAATASVVAPYFAYDHSSSVVAGDGCPTGGSSATGDLFYTGSRYPASYQHALFFMDHTRGCIWTMPAGANGLPDPSRIAIFESGAASPVDIEQGPDANIYYVDFDGGTIREITYTGANRPPTAVASADVTSGPVPLTVNFDGSGSSDPDGDPITFSWDLNGDGAFGDSTAQKPSYTYTTAGTYDVRLRVTDSNGASTTSAPIVIDAGNQPPVPVIDTPASTFTWRVGTVIGFSGHATDTEDGTEPASRLSWTIILHHCFDPTNCHTHLIQTFTGVASGSFAAPDHGYPCWLEIQLTATDSTGTSATTSLRLDPQTVNLTIASSPSGAQLSFDATTAKAPFTQTVVIGSSNTVSAPTPQTIGNATYVFSSWSDGGAATHTIRAPATATTYTAKYRRAKR
jgi:glucose/arabinose dehydrogenase